MLASKKAKKDEVCSTTVEEKNQTTENVASPTPWALGGQ